MPRKTSLYDVHISLGGKMVDFAGFLLPVQYSGIIEEHRAVRTAVGMFDVSHMGEFLFRGEGAEAALNAILTNDIRGMKDGKVRYSLLPNERGGAVDDVLVYRVSAECYLMVVNGANVEKDAAWVRAHLSGCDFEDISESVALIAVQGPLSEAVMRKVVPAEQLPAGYYTFTKDITLGECAAMISRTGYTGEDGFEIFCAAADAPAVYNLVAEAGGEFGLLPCGLGARDTLRLEAGMPLYGHELADDIPVNETGLDFAIKTGKGDFVGRESILAHEPEFERIGARVKERGIVREHSDIFVGDEKVGVCTSGTHSPTLGTGICMLRVKKGCDGELFADVRGRRIALERVKLPFYKR